jgi:hypothetical protein
LRLGVTFAVNGNLVSQCALSWPFSLFFHYLGFGKSCQRVSSPFRLQGSDMDGLLNRMEAVNSVLLESLWILGVVSWKVLKRLESNRVESFLFK